MARRRFGVVLLVPEPWAAEVQGLRRALGDRSFDRVAPHITLVPPVNVRGEDVATALRVLRAAATACGRPLTLELGPARSFLPDSETAYLAVGGDAAAVDALEQVRSSVFQGPFERPLEFPFVAHVTIGDGIEPARIEAAVAVLADFHLSAELDRLHLLEEQRVDGHRRWLPVADAPFAAPVVVGRGGVELELATTEIVDPEALALLRAAAADAGPREEGEQGEVQVDGARGDVVLPPVPHGARRVVVTARRADVPVATGLGWAHPELQGEVEVVAVQPGHRGAGIATQVQRALVSATS